tara:strand:+ start:131 stop:370 length:240 start_codon:yes stop_codon:yes gene_type:complete
MTSQQIAKGIMEYSELHENDALMDKPGFRQWEIPSYCMSLEEVIEEVEEDGWKTLDEAIKALTKRFDERADYIDEVKSW